eukprot:gene14718-31290_t
MQKLKSPFQGSYLTEPRKKLCLYDTPSHDSFFLNDTSLPSSTNEQQISSSWMNFNRSKFVKNICKHEHVKLVIISTYVLDLKILQKEMPELFSHSAVIPTMILHGDKRLIISSRNNINNPNLIDIYKKKTSFISPTFQQDDETDEESFANEEYTKPNWEFYLSIPKNTIEIIKVLPQWNNCNSDSSTKARNRNKCIRGVHHPKYILVFTDRGLHVMISTGNMTAASSTDLSWTEFFPRKSFRISSYKANENENDFGHILQDFLVS